MTESETKVARTAARSGGVEVQLQALTRVYGTVTALDGLDLAIEPGELVALLGPSGCGKTTALRILAGLEDASSGRVLVGGSDISTVSANRRDMGMVFQAYSLFPHMTVQQNVEFGLKMRKVDGHTRRNRSMEMLEMVGLQSHADRYAHQLSGGQQQRVALARALAFEPSVLLLDEPLSALDAKVRAQLRDEIRRVQVEVGTTTLFVTHDQEEALAIADRVGVMRAGRLEQIAAPETLYSAPASEFVAEFVGLTNRVRAEVVDGTAQVFGTRLPLLPGSVRAGGGTALVRPESVRVSADPEGAATVTSSSFLGAITRLQVQTRDGVRLTAQVPGGTASSLRQGDRVTVALEPVPTLVVAD